MLWSAQREEQHLSDFSVSTVRKSTNSGHRKPPLRGGTMRYRADIIPTSCKQRRARASVLHFCNTRATCCVRLVHAKLQPSDAVGMRIAAAVADQHLQVAGETDEQPRTIAANSNKTALCLLAPRNLASFLGCFNSIILRFGAFGTQKAQFLFAGLHPAPRWGSAPDPISNAHVLPRQGSRAARQN